MESEEEEEDDEEHEEGGEEEWGLGPDGPYLLETAESGPGFQPPRRDPSRRPWRMIETYAAMIAQVSSAGTMSSDSDDEGKLSQESVSSRAAVPVSPRSPDTDQERFFEAKYAKQTNKRKRFK
jgi:hypothetical protein